MNLSSDIKTFKATVWNNKDNRDLLNLVQDKRLNIAPCTVYRLDQLGFNKLEIISLSACIGKIIHKLPTADLDLLDLLQDKYGVVFAYNKKIKGKYLSAKLDHLCHSFSEGIPQGVSALFSLSLYDQ